MPALSAAEVLDVWEEALPRGAMDRALVLLRSACPEQSQEALTSLSIGRWDAALLRLLVATFGPGILLVDSCPECSEQVEFEFDASELANEAASDASDVSSVVVGRYSVTFRLPTPADLFEVADEEDLEIARSRLLDRCVTEVRCDSELISSADVPPEVEASVVQAMSEADPASDLRVVISCPSCQHSWDAVFDPAAYLWDEVDAWARRLSSEVHILASSYGWSEADILALSPWRRQLYLDQVPM